MKKEFKNLEEISNKFLQIEKELNLFNEKIDGVYFWERIRVIVHRRILLSLGLINEPHAKIKKNFSNIIIFTLNSFYAFLFKNPFFSRSTEIIFFGHSRRKFLKDKKWWDIYCDPLIEKLEKDSYLYLESSYLLKHFKPAKTENLKYLDFIDFLWIVQTELGLKKMKFTKDEKEIIGRIKNKIEEEFNINIELFEILKKDLLKRKSQLSIYSRLLKKLNPKIVILLVSYGRETIVEVCKKLKIPTIELQHGIINKYHFGYSLPERKKAFPDYLFVFGDFWKNCIIFPIRKKNIFSIGYAFLEKEAVKYKNITKKNQIIFISQGNIGKELSKFATKLSEYKDIKYRIIYKLHPGEYNRWKKEYPWLVQKNIENKIKVIDSDVPSLYKLMAESRIQVGVSSTVIYEGLNFGLQTYLLDIFGIEAMNYLLTKNYAEKVKSVDGLIKKIEQNKSKKNIENEYFFKKGAQENFLEALKIIKKSKKIKK